MAPVDKSEHLGGWLRPSVEVERRQTETLIRHSLWELIIPNEQVEDIAGFDTFLSRNTSVHSVFPRTTKQSNLLGLLAVQGCLTSSGSKSHFTFREVGHLVRAASSQWYGAYYSHPFWEHFHSADLKITTVFAWALRTYHLSRSAGPTAARGALRSTNRIARDVMLKSAIEEYSHCEIYYAPIHQRFGLSPEWIKGLAPLPSSLAFDRQMSLIADDDWLAHISVARFQEYTGAFREQAFQTYERLEHDFDLDGMFQGWRDHIGYDIGHSHAEDLDEVFDQPGEVEAPLVKRSIEEAAITVSYLIWSLDQLLDVAQSDTDLRSYRTMPQMIQLGAQSSSMIKGINDLRVFQGIKSVAELVETVANLVVEALESVPKIASLRSAFVPLEIHGIALRALSVSIAQDEAVGFGRILDLALEHMAASQHDPQFRALEAPSTRFITSYLFEAAYRPFDCYLALAIASKILSNTGLETSLSVGVFTHSVERLVSLIQSENCSLASLYDRAIEAGEVFWAADQAGLGRLSTDLFWFKSVE